MTPLLTGGCGLDSSELRTLNFIGCLALYQNRRDKAVGISHISRQQRGLIWYYNTLLASHLKRAAVYGVLQTIKKRMGEIMQEAQTADLDRQRQLLVEAMALQESMEKWQRQISNTSQP